MDGARVDAAAWGLGVRRGAAFSFLVLAHYLALSEAIASADWAPGAEKVVLPGAAAWFAQTTC